MGTHRTATEEGQGSNRKLPVPLGSPSNPGALGSGPCQRRSWHLFSTPELLFTGTRSYDWPRPQVHSEAAGHVLSNTPNAYRGSPAKGPALRRACWVLAHPSVANTSLSKSGLAFSQSSPPWKAWGYTRASSPALIWSQQVTRRPARQLPVLPSQGSFPPLGWGSEG